MIWMRQGKKKEKTIANKFYTDSIHYPEGTFNKGVPCTIAVTIRSIYY